MTSTKPDRTLELVSTAYSAAIEPARFDDLLSAWDRWCDVYLNEIDSAFEGLAATFEEAVSASEKLTTTSADARIIDKSQAPIVLLDARQSVLAWNAAASALVDRGDLDLDAFVAARKRTDLNLSEAGLGAYRCSGGPQGRAYLVVEAPATPGVLAQYPNAAKVLTLAVIHWDDVFAEELQLRFGLSKAELAVARGLLEGLTAQEISGVLGRSLATIRSHIKALLSKSGTRRQMEFVQLLTILRQTAGAVEPMTPARAAGAGYREVEWTSSHGVLRGVRYGAGRPAVYFTTSSLPEEASALREAFAAVDLDVVAPARPGFRGTERHGKDASEALLQDWLPQIADELGPKPVFIGHREGGILAAKAAEWYLETGREVGGFALISTGAPTQDIAELETAPPTVKRSFLAARYAETALALGYHTAARIYHSGRLGQAKILDYFFKESPTDTAQISDPELKRIMYDNLSYCFEDPSQIARDVRDWGSDWSASLQRVAGQAPVLFLHGKDHTFRLPNQILECVDKHAAMRARLFEGEAQLLLYRRPKDIAAEIARLP